MVRHTEEHLQLIEDAAAYVGIPTKRYTVRDASAVHRILDEKSGVSKYFNPTDPYSDDLILLILKMPSFSLTKHGDDFYFETAQAHACRIVQDPKELAEHIVGMAAQSHRTNQQQKEAQ